MRRIIRGQQLTTPFAVETQPFTTYPRPQFVRASYRNLNGRWRLSVAHGARITPVGDITVPFPPESMASGIACTLDRGERWIYERELILPPEQDGERVILHIGAADQQASVYVNDRLAATHEGGYTSFSADITDLVTGTHDRLRIEVSDPMDSTFPYGKQCRRPHGMWYTPISGIWQTVWCERIPRTAIQSLHTDRIADGFVLTVRGGEEKKHLTLHTPSGTQEYDFTGERLHVSVAAPRLWSPDDPYLYHYTVQSGKDTVSSYTALRTVTVGEANGHPCICLNGKPLFLHAVLDQGYYPDGLFLPGNEDGYRADIARMKALGFNTLRKHIKIEPAVFYHECDKQGMLVMQDMVNNGRYNFLLDTALPTIGIKRGIAHPPCKRAREQFLRLAEQTVERLHEHPSVIYYTIFNEGWGQFSPDEVYYQLKALDSTRLWDATSGWFFGRDSDVRSEHVYFKPIRLKSSTRPLVLSEFGGYSCMIARHSAFPDRPYGYRRLETPTALTEALCTLYRDEILPAIKAGLCGAVLTQLSDVEEEQNGLLTYDRQVCKVDEEALRAVGETIQRTFLKY